MSRKQELWKAVSYGAGGLATLATRKALGLVWSARRPGPPPDGPGTVRAPLHEAIMWAVAVGAGVAVVRILAIRSAAKVWEITTHEPPPIPDA